MHITKAPFLEDLCLLLIFRDAHLENLKENLMRLYDPCVAKVYVCVSKKLNFLTRVRVLREIRNVFAEADIYINNVTDAQLKLVAFYSHFYTGSEPCESTNAPSLNRSSKAGPSDAHLQDNEHHEINAYLCGNMRINRIVLCTGDEVTVELSPYDLRRGRVIWRQPVESQKSQFE